MSKIKIYELADELGIERKELLAKAQAFGNSAKSTSKVLNESEAEQLRKFYYSPTSPKKEKTIFIDPKDEISESKKIPEQNKKSGLGFSEKKPKVKKKKWGKKGEAQAQADKIPLRNQDYQKNTVPKGFNQKLTNRIFIGLIAGVVLLSIGSGVSYLQAKNHVKREAQKIVQSDKGQIQKLAGSQTSQNYKAQVFLDEFVKVYFNVPKDEKTQEKAQQLLLAFYGQALPTASQGQQKNESSLNSAQLLDITDSTATYLVDYTTVTKEKVATGKDNKTTLKDVSHDNQTIFKVSYGVVNGKYYVSSFPTFEDVTSLNAGKSAPQLTLDAVTKLSKNKEKQLNTFVKSLLEAKTKDKQSLDLLADGLSLSSSEELVSIDYTNFQSEGKDTYKAVVQATFKNGLGTHPENYVFTINKTNSTFFARDFKNVITAQDMETMKG